MRLSILDLLPNTKYAVQVRANDGETVSPWSRVYYLTTIQDSAVPNTPTNPTWVVSGDSFHGEWDSITTNTNGEPSVVTHYEIELTSGATVKVVSVPQKTDGTKVTYDLSFEANRALFGTPKGSISMRVRAVDNVNLPSAWTNSINAQNALPSPVTGLTALSITDGIDLKWTAPTDTDILGYNIYVGTTSGFTTSSSNKVGFVTAPWFTYNTSTYTLQYVKVTTVDVFGQESTAVQTSGTPKSPFAADTTAPGVPTNLAATIARDSMNNAFATLTWTAPTASDLAGYVIRYKKTTDTYWTTQNIDKSATTAVIPLLASFTDYNFAIAAYDKSANYSAFTATVTATGSIAGAPPQVTGVTATAGNESLMLAWTASSAADVIKYEVQVATDAAFTQNLLDYTTGNTSITIAGLTPGTTYYYQVRAIDTSGTNGTWSTAASVTLGNYPTGGSASDGVVPATPGAPNVSGGIGYLFVTWTPVTTNASGGTQKDPLTYEVQLSTTTGFTPSSSTKVAEVSGTVVTLDKDATGAELAYSTTYYIKLVAKDADGSSAASAQGSGTLNQATSSDISSVGVDKLATGAISSATITLTSSGVIESSNYAAGSAGWKISSAGIEMNDANSKISVASLQSGTWTGKNLTIGTGGSITVDQTGVIKSNNYAAGVTGWQLSDVGLELNDANSAVKADAIVGGTIGAHDISIASGGSIHSSDYDPNNWYGWSLSGTGLTVYEGTIVGNTIKGGQLVSSSQVTRNGALVPAWSINMDGNAQFNDALVHGHLIVGDAGGTEADSYLQSGNFVAGTTGWIIRGDGSAEFRNITTNSMLSNTLTVEARNSESILVNSTFEDPAVVNGVWNYNNFAGWTMVVDAGAPTLSQNTATPISGSRSVRITFPTSTAACHWVHTSKYPVIPGQTWTFSVKLRSSIALDKSAIADAAVATVWMRTSVAGYDPNSTPDGVNVIWTDVTDLETTYHDDGTWTTPWVQELFDLATIPANHTQMTVALEIPASGTSSWYVDIDDFRTALNMDEFDIYAPDGTIAASIDSTGSMSLSGDLGVAGSIMVDASSLLLSGAPITDGIHVGDLESDNEPVFAGTDLTQWIRNNYRMRIAVAQSSSVDSSIGGSGIWGVITVGNMKAANNYRIYYAFAFSTTGSEQDWESGVYYEADGVTTPSINSTRLPASVVKHVSTQTGGKIQTVQKMCQYSPPADGTIKFGFGMARVNGAGVGTIYWGAQNRPIIFVEDLGPISGTGAIIAQKNKTSGTADTDPTPTTDTYTPTKYTRTWTATWSRSYQGDGSQFGTDGKDIHQGYYSGTNGNTKGAIGFDDADIRNHLADPGGGKPNTVINKVEVYLYFNHWYYNSGGTAVLGRHSISSAANAGTWSDVLSGPSYADAQRSTNWPKPGGRWVDITSMNSGGWKSGDNKGILLGPGPTTSKLYYGIANGPNQSNPPKLRITYTK